MSDYMQPAVSVNRKPWGLNRHLLQREDLELHHATIAPGGYSSRHRHTGKDNYFYVVSGKLTVEYFVDRDATVPRHSLEVRMGQQVVLDADEWHRFINHGETAVDLIEVYWTAEPEAIVRHEDIDRADVGGKLEPD